MVISQRPLSCAVSTQYGIRQLEDDISIANAKNLIPPALFPRSLLRGDV